MPGTAELPIGISGLTGNVACFLDGTDTPGVLTLPSTNTAAVTESGVRPGIYGFQNSNLNGVLAMFQFTKTGATKPLYTGYGIAKTSGTFFIYSTRDAMLQELMKQKTDGLPADPASATNVIAVQTAVIAAVDNVPTASENATAIAASLTKRTISVVSPLFSTVDNVPVITIVSGDDYQFSDGRQLVLPPFVGEFPNWTGGTATVEFGSKIVPAVMLQLTGTTRNVYFELTSEDSAELFGLADPDSDYGILFDLVVTLSSGNRTTLINQGVLQVNPSVA